MTARNWPRVSTEAGMYNTVQPNKKQEMIELDKRDLPRAELQPQQLTTSQNDEITLTTFDNDAYNLITIAVPHLNAARMGVIPVEEFQQHCINHHHSRDAGFEAEYEVCLAIFNF